MALLRARVARAAAIAAAALIGVAEGQSGGFSGSCFAETYEFVNPYLGMYCRNRNVWEYGYNWTWINLDLCIANRNGQLAGWENGNYLSTCGGCSTLLESDTVLLGCNCFDERGRRPGSTLDLNGFIFNQDGTMGCFSNLGNKTLVGPVPPPRQTTA